MVAPGGQKWGKAAVYAAFVSAWMLLDGAAAPAQAAMDQASRLELEELLHELGFSPGTVDGEIDDATRTAIGQYHQFAFITGQEPEATPALLAELRGVALQVRELRETAPADAPAEPDLADYGTLEPAQEPPTESPQEPEVAPPPAETAGDQPPLETSAGAETVQDPPPEATEPAEAQSAALPPQSQTEVGAETEVGAKAEAGSGSELASEPLSENARAFIQEGAAALQAGQADRAIALLTAALGLQPDQMAAYELRAAALVAKGNFNSAVGDFDQVVRLAPHNPAAYNNRCWVLGQAGRYAEALRDCELALSMAPDFAPAYHSRGQVLEMLGRDEEALEDYARAYALDPDNPEIAQDADRLGLAE